VDNSFGPLLRGHRRARGLTQEALAGMAGLSSQAVGALERGDRRFPYRYTLARLADALELTDDHRAMFVAAARRRGTPRDVTSAYSVPPRQLPSDLAHFIGRDPQVRSLGELLVRSPAVVVAVIAGMGGIGKTCLAVHVGHVVAGRFPDGQLYLDLQAHSAALSAQEALRQLMRAIDITGDAIPTDVAEAAARYRSGLAGRRVLLILDNAANAEQVIPLLPGSPGCAAIITSRHTLNTLPQAHHLRLAALSKREAVQLLAASAGQQRVDAEPDAAVAVAHHCGGLPLAIHFAGERLAARPGWPIAHLAQQLADEHRRLDMLERDDKGVRASFAVSVDHLDRQDAAAYAMLALPHGPDISLPVAARLLGSSEPDAERVLERLTDMHLLETTAPGQYQMHDLLRLYARERTTDLVSGTSRTAALNSSARAARRGSAARAETPTSADVGTSGADGVRTRDPHSKHSAGALTVVGCDVV